MPIKFLSPQDAQKVAAGEVIERPANSIKELLENSIDAGATHIELSVHEGGKKSIRITDNGTGMSYEDAHLCFKRYATSKLSSFDDLTYVTTFGFRGEALASICGVARVTLTTKQQGSLEGLQLHIEEGAVREERTVSCPVGTTFLITDLFYTMPARKKFLKSTATEWNQILALFKAFCLTYPTLHFVLLHDDATVFNCPPVTSLAARIAQLFEYKITSNLCTLTPSDEQGISVQGVITNPQYGRYDRSGLYFFVNNRLVKNYQLGRAVLKGFNNVLPPDKYPLAVLHIQVDPTTVDVNIHPKKEEVQFLHPHKVEQAITQTVRKTLEDHLHERLTASSMRSTPSAQNSYAASSLSSEGTRTNFDPFFMRKAQTSEVGGDEKISTVFSKNYESNFSSSSPGKTVGDPGNQNNQSFIEEQEVLEQPSYHIIGQHQLTYILLEHADGLLVVDQHAAHERILYERFAQNFGTTETIKLLFPLVVTLSAQEVALVLPYCDLLQKHGITLEQFGEEHLRITAIPVYAKQVPLQELLTELVGWIIENDSHPADDFFKQVTEKMRAQLACKAAVKAGDALSHEQMKTLLKDLGNTNNRFSCPHGRPTQWLLSTHEIEKKFKRIS